VVDDAAVPGAEDDATKADAFGPAWARGLGVFAGSHCEEVGSERDVGGLGVGRVLY
jgi:hypothetical protein